MRIDSHQHFWKFRPAEYPWINDSLAVLKRDYLPAHLVPELQRARIDGCVAVQARQTLGESRWLLELADHNAVIKGVVGWIDLRSPQVETQLAQFVGHPRFRGVRHVVQDEPDDNFVLGADFQNGLGKLAAMHLTYDLLIFPKQLPATIKLVQKFPSQKFVLDHLAKPLIREGQVEPWAEQIRELARHPNVLCKLSGMVTESRWNVCSQDDFKPYLDVVFESFGPSRLMFGSDWPVALLAASYDDVFSIVDSYIAQLPAADQQLIMGQTAWDFYKLMP